jgi:M6 family metalloprotease-like protein
MAKSIVAASGMVMPAPPSRHTVGDYSGLCLLVQFPDVPGTISQEEVQDFCNQQGYQGFDNRGSVHDYFVDNSIGKLRYTTVVAPYYTAIHPRDYYTNPTVEYGQRTRELIREALSFHLQQGFDFSGLTADDEDFVYATNVFYAGPRVNNWREGLWPHASRLINPFPLGNGIRAADYQITEMSDSLTLGTYCHENGHMLCDFPDLYDYGAPGIQSGGIGSYCLMCLGGNVNKRNPTQICAYLKYEAGWANTLTTLTPGLRVMAGAGTNDFFIYSKDATEYFIVENRDKTGRDVALPDAGLAIWHVDALGNNSREQMTPTSHYECSLEQADGRFDLERGDQNGDDKDLFHAGWKVEFSNTTTPSSKWWNGTPSGLTIRQIGAAGPQLEFEVG